MLDRFELIAELASGGMATVFLARLSGVAGFQRLVAIKRLHPHLAKEPEFVEMFLDEARLAARIHHPNVVPIQEVGESERGYYLVMDFVDGDTFARLLARAAQSKKTIPWGVTVRIMLDVLAGLHSAHEQRDDQGAELQLVHRDVSPQNILVGIDGIARITDFGVARAASRLSTTRSGQLKGKLAYMAPEQAKGVALDRRADVFSCGIVLWEALTVKRLFKGEGEAETLNRVLYDPIAPPTSVRPDVPKQLADVVMKALERDADKRYATALEFADALEAAGRELGLIGQPREVAAVLDDVIGADLKEQREAVRGWLARSEPSASSRRSVPPPSVRPKDQDVTRVETKSEPSSKRAATSLAPSSAPPEKVSSVSSAVIHVSAPSSRGRVVLLVAAAALCLGIGAWAATRFQQAPADTARPSPPPPPPPPPPPATTTSAAAPPPAASSAAAPEIVPSAVPSVRPVAVKPAPARPVRPPAKPQASAPAPPPTSDAPDLSNPYR